MTAHPTDEEIAELRFRLHNDRSPAIFETANRAAQALLALAEIARLDSARVLVSGSAKEPGPSLSAEAPAPTHTAESVVREFRAGMEREQRLAREQELVAEVARLTAALAEAAEGVTK